MVQHKEVTRLYALCHDKFVEYLGEKVFKASYEESRGNATLSAYKQQLRPFFLQHIPSAGDDHLEYLIVQTPEGASLFFPSKRAGKQRPLVDKFRL